MIVRVCIAVTCALFVALGVLALIAGQLAVGCALWLAIAGLVIFVPVVVSHALYLRGRHGLALTPTGVRLYGWGDAQVDWKDIRESRVFIRGSYIHLGIVPLEPVRVRRRWQRLSAWRKEVAFPAQLLIGNPFIAVLTVKQYVEAADRRAEIGTEPELIRVLAGWRAA